MAIRLLSVLLLAGAASAHPSFSTHPPKATITQRALVQRASSSPLPLTAYTYAYSDIPYQVNPFPVGRGPQSGYNLCNSTTENADSQCQTIILNSLADFCLWGSPTTDVTGAIGDIEAAVVAYCTWAGHGTRIIRPGTITAAQFIRTSAYIQITGLLDQTGVNLMANDTGGELDPHGADLLGNPLGGLMYSNSLPGGDNSTYVQGENWNLFIGSGIFCFKACYNSITSPDYCQNKLDLIGCAYNMPASYAPNEFTSCDGDLQDVVGVYTVDGRTTTWSQPSSLTPGYVMPYTPRIPASSNCQTYQSTDLYPLSRLGYQSTLAASVSTTTSSAATSAVSTGSGLTTSPTSTGSRTTSTSTSTSTSKATQTGSASNIAVSKGAFVGAVAVVAALFV